jgi:hypothetical protein
MSKILFVLFFSIIHFSAYTQKTPAKLEILLYSRLDKYPEFSLPGITGPTDNTDYITLKGISWGINAGYKIPLSKNLFLKPAMGFYKYSFSKITRFNTYYKKEYHERPIDYEPGRSQFIFYGTDKYWYNTVLFQVSIERQFMFKNNLQLCGGITLGDYYTISQKYHIDTKDTNPELPNPYKLPDKRNFGITSSIYASLLKQFGKFDMGPTLILPVYDRWKQDGVFFGETSSQRRDKWLGGIGLGFTCNYSFK